MKKLLPYILLVTILLGGVVTPVSFFRLNSVHAAPDGLAPLPDQGSGGFAPLPDQKPAGNNKPAPSPGAAAGVTATTTEPQLKKDLGGDSSWYVEFAKAVLGFLCNLILSIAALFLWITGLLFDWIIDGTVAGMGGILSRVGTIRVAWTAARDIANGFFIFILLYLSIATILDLGVETKKQVVRVVTMAVLINFSLFFTNVIIDASNLIATGFYNQTLSFAQKTNGDQARSITGSGLFRTDRPMSISAVFMNALAIQKIYSPNESNRDAQVGYGSNLPTNPNVESTTFLRIIATTLFGSFFMFSTGLVFLASISLFGGRVAAFLMCMVFSPIAFACMAIPGDEYSKKIYWDQLIPQAMFAPIYMLFLQHLV